MPVLIQQYFAGHHDDHGPDGHPVPLDPDWHSGGKVSIGAPYFK